MKPLEYADAMYTLTNNICNQKSSVKFHSKGAFSEASTLRLCKLHLNRFTQLSIDPPFV